MIHGGGWQRVARCRDESAGDLDRLASLLTRPDPDFAAWFAERTAELATAQMWDATVLVQGWISEAGFAAVRAWLTSLGQATFTAVRDDPDALAELYPSRAELDHPALLRLREWARPAAANDLPGEWTNISDDRAVKARFPRLYGLVDARRCR